MRRTLLVCALLLGALGCREDKGEKREEATSKPVPIAMDAADLLRPGGAEKVQKALAKAGFEENWKEGELDLPTSTALRQFQKKQKMAATGVPDEKTVAELGLSLHEVFKHRGDEEKADEKQQGR